MRLAPLAALILTASPAAAAGLIRAHDPDVIATMLSDSGYRAEIDKDDYGDPVIRSAAEGVNFSIVFYNCTDGANCTSNQFTAGFNKDDPISASSMNKWNRVNRFGAAFIDDEGDPYLQIDVDMYGGIPKATLDHVFARWQALLGNFKAHNDW
jgi:hypothetical protein